MMKKRKQRLAPLFLAGVLAVGSLLIGGSLEAKAAGADHIFVTSSVAGTGFKELFDYLDTL